MLDCEGSFNSVEPIRSLSEMEPSGVSVEVTKSCTNKDHCQTVTVIAPLPACSARARARSRMGSGPSQRFGAGPTLPSANHDRSGPYHNLIKITYQESLGFVIVTFVRTRD